MIKHFFQVVSFTSVALIAFPAFAENRATPDGYAADSQGNVLQDSYGNCVRSGSWSEDKAKVVGCDGYTLSHDVEVIKGQPIKDGIVSYDLPFAKLFSFNKADISDEGKMFLKQTAKDLSSVLAKAYSITVVGHTDNSGNEQYNYELSKRRADIVSEYLVSLGVSEDKVRTLGVGPSHPIADNSTKEGRALNRRAELLVIGQPKAMDRMIFPSVALFERRSAELTPEGIAVLQENARKAQAEFDSAAVIEIVGHTDDVGSEEYNDELSLARAEAIGQYLTEMGVNPNKLLMTGAGKGSPVASNATDEGRQENRRVEILVVGRIKQN